MILDYAQELSTVTNALKEGGGQKSESEEDVITEERNRECNAAGFKERGRGDFPGGPMAEKQPSNVGRRI